MSQHFTTVTTKEIFSAYSPYKIKVALTCPPPGRTKQSFKAECDINTIIKRFMKTGVLDFVAKNEPRYGDCTGIEYTKAMQTVAAAKSLFNDLPAALRARFENEPALFLDFIQDEKNRDEARELGLLKPVAASSPPEATPPAPPPRANSASALSDAHGAYAG